MKLEDEEINKDVAALFNHLLAVVHRLSPAGRREMRRIPVRTIALSPTAILVGDVGLTRRTSLNRAPRIQFRYGDTILAGNVYVAGSYIMHYLPVADSQNTDRASAHAKWPRSNATIIFRRERGGQIIVVPTTEEIRHIFTKGPAAEDGNEVAEAYVYEGGTMVLLARVQRPVNYRCAVVMEGGAYDMMRQMLLRGAHPTN